MPCQTMHSQARGPRTTTVLWFGNRRRLCYNCWLAGKIVVVNSAFSTVLALVDGTANNDKTLAFIDATPENKIALTTYDVSKLSLS